MGNKQGHELSPEDKQRIKDEKEREKQFQKEQKERRKRERKELKKRKRKEGDLLGIPEGKGEKDDAKSEGGESQWSEKSQGSGPNSWYHSASEPSSRRSSVYHNATAGPGYYQHDCWYSGYDDVSEKSEKSKPPSRCSSTKEHLNIRAGSLERYPLGVPTGEAIEPLQRGTSLDLTTVAATEYLKEREKALMTSNDDASIIANRYEENMRLSKDRLDKALMEKRALIERASMIGSKTGITEDLLVRGEKRKTEIENLKSDEAANKRQSLDNASITGSITGSVTGSSLAGSIYYSADEGGSGVGSIYYSATSGSDNEDQEDEAFLKAERPGAPGVPEAVDREGSTFSKLAYIRVENDALLLRWDPPISDGGSPITGYIIEKCEGDGDFWVRVNLVPTKETEYAVAHLVGGREYRFRVAAENALGLSEPSDPSQPVTVALDEESTEPHFLKELRNITAVAGQKVEFTVDVIGTPSPDVTWFKDGFEIYDTERFEFNHVGDRFILVLKECNLSDEGDIRVRATNRTGVASSQATLSVQAPPQIDLPSQYEQGLIFDTDELMRLKIPYMSRPQPEVEWTHNGKLVEPDDRHTIDVSEKYVTLKIAGASRQDKGLYGVALKNPQGEDKASFFVTVTDMPNSPSRPYITDIIGSSVSLKWDPPADDGGCRITNYIVEYFRVGWDVWLKATSSRIPVAQLNDLIIGSEYQFRIKAENAYGISPPGPVSETILIDDKTPSGSFEYQTYESTTNAGSSFPQDTHSAVLMKGDSSSVEGTEEEAFSRSKQFNIGLDEVDIEGKATLTQEKLTKLKSAVDTGYEEKDLSLQDLASLEEKLEARLTKEQLKSVALMSAKEREAFLLKEKKAFFSTQESSDLLDSSTFGKDESYDIHWQRGEDAPIPIFKSDQPMELESPLTPRRGSKKARKSPAQHSEIASTDLLSDETTIDSTHEELSESVPPPSKVSKTDPKAAPYSTPSPLTSGPGCLKVRMESVTVASGGEAILVVALENLVPAKIVWQKGGKELEHGPHFTSTLTEEAATLIIHDATPNDTGTYTAIVTRQDGSQAKAAVALRVATASVPFKVEPPIFVRPLSDLAAKVGTRVRFLVELRAAHEVMVYWLHRNLEVVEDSRHRLLHEGNFFCVDISPLTVEDEGPWKCVAENSSGQASCSAALRVIVPRGYKPPVFLEELEAILTTEGTVSLECKVVGVPTPILKWYKDGIEIKAGDVFALTANPNDPTSLGTYTCEAINCMGKGISSSKVRVVSRDHPNRPPSSDRRSPTPVGPLPIILQHLSDRKVKIGDKTRLSVKVNIPPEVQNVVWYHNSQRIEANDKYRLSDEGGGGIFILEISPLELGDDGDWKVAIRNPGGYASSSCRITLAVPRNYRSPRFLEDLKALLTEEGLVSFECKVVGYPTPVLQWFKDGQELKPGDVYQLSGTNSLGKYSCIAKNVMGECMSSAELTLEDIKSHLNEAEKELLLATNIPPRFIQGLQSRDCKIGDSIKLTVQVTVSPEAQVTWYHEDDVINEGPNYKMTKNDPGIFHLEITSLELADQGEWKCLATNDYGHSVTAASIKLVIPRHYKKPVFLEPLRAVLSQEGTVNLECKVIGVPQPILKWFKDGTELKPGDIHRIISGEDGTCCLGTYTCEAINCMGSASSSAALLGFEDKLMSKEEGKEGLQMHEARGLLRNPSLSTINEEHTSQISVYESAVSDGSMAEDEKTEISVSVDGRDVSMSLYETPDISEADAKKIANIYAEEISDRFAANEGSNLAELPPLRFTRESSRKGPLVMEAMVIDMENQAFDDYMTMADIMFDDLRTEADVEELSALEAVLIDERECLRSDIADIPDLGEEHISAKTVSTEGKGVVNINQANVFEPDLKSLSEQGLSMLKTEAKGNQVPSHAEAILLNKPKVLMADHAKEIQVKKSRSSVSSEGDTNTLSDVSPIKVESPVESDQSKKIKAPADEPIEKTIKKIKKTKESKGSKSPSTGEQVYISGSNILQDDKDNVDILQIENQQIVGGYADKNIPEILTYEATEADVSDMHSLLEPMQYSEKYSEEIAQDIERQLNEKQMATMFPGIHEAATIEFNQDLFQTTDMTMEAHISEHGEAIQSPQEAILIEEIDVDSGNIQSFVKQDVSDVIAQAISQDGSMKGTVVIEEADIHSEEPINLKITNEQAVNASESVAEGAKEKCVVQDLLSLQEQNDKKRIAEGDTIGNQSDKKIKLESSENETSTVSEMDAKKEELRAKIEQLRSKSDVDDVISSDSVTPESSESLSKKAAPTVIISDLKVGDSKSSMDNKSEALEAKKQEILNKKKALLDKRAPSEDQNSDLTSDLSSYDEFTDMDSVIDLKVGSTKTTKVTPKKLEPTIDPLKDAELIKAEMKKQGRESLERSTVQTPQSEIKRGHSLEKDAELIKAELEKRERMSMDRATPQPEVKKGPSLEKDAELIKAELEKRGRMSMDRSTPQPEVNKEHSLEKDAELIKAELEKREKISMDRSTPQPDVKTGPSLEKDTELIKAELEKREKLSMDRSAPQTPLPEVKRGPSLEKDAQLIKAELEKREKLSMDRSAPQTPLPELKRGSSLEKDAELVKAELEKREKLSMERSAPQTPLPEVKRGSSLEKDAELNKAELEKREKISMDRSISQTPLPEVKSGPSLEKDAELIKAELEKREKLSMDRSAPQTPLPEVKKGPSLDKDAELIKTELEKREKLSMDRSAPQTPLPEVKRGSSLDKDAELIRTEMEKREKLSMDRSTLKTSQSDKDAELIKPVVEKQTKPSTDPSLSNKEIEKDREAGSELSKSASEAEIEKNQLVIDSIKNKLSKLSLGKSDQSTMPSNDNVKSPVTSESKDEIYSTKEKADTKRKSMSPVSEKRLRKSTSPGTKVTEDEEKYDLKLRKSMSPEKKVAEEEKKYDVKLKKSMSPETKVTEEEKKYDVKLKKSMSPETKVSQEENKYDVKLRKSMSPETKVIEEEKKYDVKLKKSMSPEIKVAPEENKYDVKLRKSMSPETKVAEEEKKYDVKLKKSMSPETIVVEEENKFDVKLKKSTSPETKNVEEENKYDVKSTSSSTKVAEEENKYDIKLKKSMSPEAKAGEKEKSEVKLRKSMSPETKVKKEYDVDSNINKTKETISDRDMTDDELLRLDGVSSVLKPKISENNDSIVPTTQNKEKGRELSPEGEKDKTKEKKRSVKSPTPDDKGKSRRKSATPDTEKSKSKERKLERKSSKDVIEQNISGQESSVTEKDNIGEKRKERKLSEDKTTDKKRDSKSVERKTSEDKSEKKISERKSLERKLSEDKLKKKQTDSQTMDRKSSERKSVEQKSTTELDEREDIKEKTIEKKPSERKSVERKTKEEKAIEKKSSDRKLVERKSVEKKISDEKASEKKISDRKSSERKSSEEKILEKKTNERKSVERKSTEESISDKLSEHVSEKSSKQELTPEENISIGLKEFTNNEKEVKEEQNIANKSVEDKKSSERKISAKSPPPSENNKINQQDLTKAPQSTETEETKYEIQRKKSTTPDSKRGKSQERKHRVKSPDPSTDKSDEKRHRKKSATPEVSKNDSDKSKIEVPKLAKEKETSRISETLLKESKTIEIEKVKDSIPDNKSRDTAPKEIKEAPKDNIDSGDEKSLSTLPLKKDATKDKVKSPPPESPKKKEPTDTTETPKSSTKKDSTDLSLKKMKSPTPDKMTKKESMTSEKDEKIKKESSYEQEKLQRKQEEERQAAINKEAELRRQEEILNKEKKQAEEEKKRKEREELEKMELKEKERLKEIEKKNKEREEKKRLEEEAFKKEQEKALEERRKRREEEMNKEKIEEENRLKQENERREARKREREEQVKQMKEEQDRFEEEEKQRKERLAQRKREEEERSRREEEERKESQRRRKLEQEKSIKLEEEKRKIEEQEHLLKRKKEREEQEKSFEKRMQEKQEQQAKAEKERLEDRLRRKKEREEEERMMKEEEDRRRERRWRRDEEEKLSDLAGEMKRMDDKRKTDEDVKKLEEELKRREEAKRKRDEEILKQGEEFLRLEEERRKRRLEERKRREMEDSREKSINSFEIEERRRKAREQREIEYSEKELIETSRYASLLERRNSRTSTPEDTRRRDPRRRPKFSTKLSDRQTVKGTRVRLTCNIINIPEDDVPEIEWFKSGYPMKEDDRIKFYYHDGVASLELDNVTRSDSAEYTCTARNRHGRASTSCDLRVKGEEEQKPSPPTFTTSLREGYVSEDDQLVLTCHVTGHPQPKITWMKDQDQLPSSPRFQTSQSKEGVCKLIISHPRSADSGVYICHAENRVYRDQISTTIQVSALIQKYSKNDARPDDSESPRFISDLKDQMVEENGTLTLQVEVTGSPPPEVLWLFNGRSINPSGKTRISTNERIHTLTVFQVTPSDIGTYSCRISNSYGSSYSISSVSFGTPVSKRLTEATTEGAEPKAPTFAERPESLLTVFREEEISLSCTVQGEPTPRVTWKRGSQDVSLGYRAHKSVRGNTHCLVIRDAQFTDSGTYTVEVKNSQGTVRAYCSVKVRENFRSTSYSPRPSVERCPTPQCEVDERRMKSGRFIRDVPGKVGQPCAADIGKNYVSLQWEKPGVQGGAPVTAYKVESWILGEEARWQELGVTPISSMDAYHLKTDREYLFRVTPRNKYGWGEPVMTPRPIKVGRTIEHPNFPRTLPSQVRCMPGGSILLDAEVSGEPMPEIRWYKDGSFIDPKKYPRFSSLTTEGAVHDLFGLIHKISLKIDNVQWDDDGKYEIEAINPGGRVTSHSRIITTHDCSVLEAQARINSNLIGISRKEDVASLAPQFTMRLRDRRVQVGFPVRLTCQIVGVPKPDIQWYRDDILLTEDDCHTICQEDGHFYTVEISNARHEDAAVYSVCASNTFGSVLCRCRLIVDSGLRSYISPMFLRELEDQSVKEGEDIVLQTVIEAYPTIGVVWHRDGHRIRPTRKHWFSLDADGLAILVIQGADHRDGGIYTCTASNDMGCIESYCRVSVSTTDLEVMKKKDIDRLSLGPMFLRKPRTIDAEEGDMVIIECEVVGDPKPEVQWLRDWIKPSAYSDGSRFQEVGTGPIYRLEIPNCKVQDTGAYSIVAKNEHGETRAIISLQVYAKGLKGNLEPGAIRRGVMEHVPVVEKPLQDVRCCDGDSVTLETHIDAPKTSLVRWEKQGKVIKEGGDIFCDWDGSRARLRIREVFPEDEGEYSCIVFNDMGKTVTSATLVVEMADDKENDVTVQMEHRPDLSRRTTPSRTSRTTTPSRWSRSPSVAFQREGSAHSWAGAGVGWREASVGVSQWRPLSRGSSPLLFAHRRTPEPTARAKSRRNHGPKFYYIPHDKIVEEGETVTFQCAIKGHPTPKAIWDKDSIRLPTGGRIRYEERDEVRIIEIPKVTQQDAGLYRVTIENDLGREQATARLDVIKSSGNKYAGYVRSWHTTPMYIPSFNRTVHSSTVREGSRLSLSADYRASPLPRAKWYKNNELLPDCCDYPQTNNGSTITLEINQTSLNDAGTYTCVLENDAGNSRCSCQVMVEQFEDHDKTAPYFIQGLGHVTATTGEDIRLPVQLGGTNPMKVVWVHNDKELEHNENCQCISETNGSHTLVLKNTTPDLSGIYFCEAYNVYGESNCYCRVNVNEPCEENTSTPPYISEALKAVEVEEGSSAAFKIVARGDPAPNITWQLNGRRLASSPRIQITDTEGKDLNERIYCLTISHALATDTGEISAIITNTQGTQNDSTTLKVIVDEEDLRKYQSLENSLEKCSTINSSSSPNQSRSSSRCRQPLKELSFSTSMDSAYGSGRSSVLSTAGEFNPPDEEIKETSPSARTLDLETCPEDDILVDNDEEEGAEIIQGPTNVTALRGQSATLEAHFRGNPTPVVTWLKKEHEIEDGGRYSIRSEDGIAYLTINDVNADDCDKYSLVVRNQHSAHSAFASLAVEDVPEPPADRPNLCEVGMTSVTLSWYGPAYDGGSVVTGYTVQARKIGSLPWSTLVERWHSTSYKARSLERGAQYEFRILAHNVHGLSEPSKASCPVTLGASSNCKEEKVPEEPEEEEINEVVKFTGVEEGELFDKKFEKHEEVGKGRFGIVYRVVEKERNRRRAAKFVKCLKSKEKDKVKEEISIMNSLRHPKLLQLMAAFEKNREFIMVMEYISGGELFERVVADDFTLTERDCILFVRQICEGVQYMHKNNIIHLDLKPENILCVSRNSHQIKLIDFGLARRYDPNCPSRVLFGTPEFIAPEIINYETISCASDMWSIGVICYVLLSGLSPFMGENDAETFANITRAEYDFDDDAFSAISEAATNFITSLLVKRKEKRLTASECLDHEWLGQSERSMKKVALSTDKLKKFIIRRKWQKTGTAIRALGRMTNLKSRRSSQPTSPTRLTPLPENQSQPYSPSSSQSSIVTLASLAKNRCYSPKRSSSSTVSERSDSGISECSIATEESQRSSNFLFNPIKSSSPSINTNLNSSSPTGTGVQSGKTPSLNWQTSVDSVIDDVDYTSKEKFVGGQRKLSNEALLHVKAGMPSHMSHSRI